MIGANGRVEHKNINLAYGSWSDKFVVIDKPSGMPSQMVEEKLKQMGSIPKDARVWMPHRLDKHTRGLLIIAFNKSCVTLLSRDFTQRKFVKRYRTIVDKPPCIKESASRSSCCLTSPLVQGSLFLHNSKNRLALSSEPIKIGCFLARRETKQKSQMMEILKQKSLNESSKRQEKCTLATHLEDMLESEHMRKNLTYTPVTDMHPDAKYSISEFHLVKESETKALYDVILHTGRPHQIRVHASEAGLPITNDPYYNYHWVHTMLNKKDFTQLPATDLEMYLQAYHLEFDHPLTGEQLKITLPWPEEWPQTFKPESLSGKTASL